MRDNLNAWEAFGAIDVVLAVAAALAIAVLVVALVSEPPPALVAAADRGGRPLAALLIVYRLIDVPDIPSRTPATPPTRPAGAWECSSACSARPG